MRGDGCSVQLLGGGPVRMLVDASRLRARAAADTEVVEVKGLPVPSCILDSCSADRKKREYCRGCAGEYVEPRRRCVKSRAADRATRAGLVEPLHNRGRQRTSGFGCWNFRRKAKGKRNSTALRQTWTQVLRRSRRVLLVRLLVMSLLQW